jgi:hypothetical protein
MQERQAQHETWPEMKWRRDFSAATQMEPSLVRLA